MAKQKFPMYKGKPLVRCGDVVYYGDMSDSCVAKLTIKSKKTVNGAEVPDKVGVQLLSTNEDISPRKRIIKSSEKDSLYLAMDIADVWLERELSHKTAE